jgi:hypothetical protein
MKKSGGISIVLGIIFVILILVVAGVGFYFYNFHVFKEVRICLGESEDTSIPCMVREDCLETFNISLDALESSPEFVKNKAGDVLDKAVYCEGTCFIRMTRGIDFESGELELLSSCGDNEEEIVVEVRGRDGLEMLEWMKNRA